MSEHCGLSEDCVAGASERTKKLGGSQVSIRCAGTRRQAALGVATSQSLKFPSRLPRDVFRTRGVEVESATSLNRRGTA